MVNPSHKALIGFPTGATAVNEQNTRPIWIGSTPHTQVSVQRMKSPHMNLSCWVFSCVLAPLHELHHWLFSRFLTYCPSKRILSDEGLKHEYFRETPLPIDPSMFPTWPAKSEQQRVKRGTSPRPPEGGLGYSHLVRTLGSTFSITYSYQAFRTLSVLNRLQTYRLLLCVRVFPPCVFHDEHPLVPNVFSSGPPHAEASGWLLIFFNNDSC